MGSQQILSRVQPDACTRTRCKRALWPCLRPRRRLSGTVSSASCCARIATPTRSTPRRQATTGAMKLAAGAAPRATSYAATSTGAPGRIASSASATTVERTSSSKSPRRMQPPGSAMCASATRGSSTCKPSATGSTGGMLTATSRCVQAFRSGRECHVPPRPRPRPHPKKMCASGEACRSALLRRQRWAWGGCEPADLLAWDRARRGCGARVLSSGRSTINAAACCSCAVCAGPQRRGPAMA